MNRCYIFLFFLTMILFVGSILPVVGQDVGDIITFGSYEQDDQPGADPVEWQVLGVENGRALLISRYILAAKPYNEEKTDSTWENCSLRAWLNQEFYNDVFSAEEKMQIDKATVSNPRNPEYGTYGGNETKDKIFLLSINEADNYLPTPELRQCEATDFAKQNGAAVLKNGCTDWWLRSPGSKASNAVSVDFYGRPYLGGVSLDYTAGVRPALLMNLTGDLNELPASSIMQEASGPSDMPSFSGAQVGDIITFGSYVQDKLLSKDPIEWFVVAVENDRVLAVSRYGLDVKPYNEDFIQITWETSTLRAWLNDEFYTNAFSDFEKAYIAESELDNPDNPDYGTSGGNTTVDKIFLLSIDEVNQYMPKALTRDCNATEYAKQNGAMVDRIYGLSSWWLRSPGENSHKSAAINQNGSIRSVDCITDDYVVRPALWLKIEP